MVRRPARNADLAESDLKSRYRAVIVGQKCDQSCTFCSLRLVWNRVAAMLTPCLSEQLLQWPPCLWRAEYSVRPIAGSTRKASSIIRIGRHLAPSSSNCHSRDQAGRPADRPQARPGQLDLVQPSNKPMHQINRSPTIQLQSPRPQPKKRYGISRAS